MSVSRHEGRVEVRDSDPGDAIACLVEGEVRHRGDDRER
jgi:hypothetical protein